VFGKQHHGGQLHRGAGSAAAHAPRWGGRARPARSVALRGDAPRDRPRASRRGRTARRGRRWTGEDADPAER